MVQLVEGVALVLHLLHRAPPLVHPQGLLRQVDVEERGTLQLHLTLHQRVEHHHHPDRPQPPPVGRQLVEQRPRVHPGPPAAGLAVAEPPWQHGAHIVEVSLQPVVEFQGDRLFEGGAVGQQFAVDQSDLRGLVGDVQLKVDAVRAAEGLLDVVLHAAPHQPVRYVDRAEKVGGRISLHRPQEGRQPRVLQTTSSRDTLCYKTAG